MESILPAAGSAFGDRVRQRLQQDVVIWMTTVGRDGTPQPNPVWFLWDGDSLLVYNRSDAARVGHIRSRPRVALNFDGNGGGGDIVVLTGYAAIDQEAPPAGGNQAYADKYREHIVRIGHNPETFANQYPVAIRIRPTAIRGF